MTLKQFGKLAAGIISALIIYGINPPGFIKWPLIFFLSGVGFAMAFVPFEGRPIDIWILAFFKRIYSPTQYIWRKKEIKTTPITPQPIAASPSPSVPASFPPISPPAWTVQPVTLQQQQPIVQPIPSGNQPETVPKPLWPTKPNIPPPTPRVSGKKVEAKFTPEVVIPATPSLPNLVVGFTRTKEGKLIDGAILEIRDSQGNPVRAFKTNKLGQFLSATPLLSGEYEIETEKEGFQFDIIKINLEGKILPPIEIVSK